MMIGPGQRKKKRKKRKKTFPKKLKISDQGREGFAKNFFDYFFVFVFFFICFFYSFLDKSYTRKHLCKIKNL